MWSSSSAFASPADGVYDRTHSVPDTHMVFVAQSVRALVCGTRGRGFDSRHSPQASVSEWLGGCLQNN